MKGASSGDRRPAFSSTLRTPTRPDASSDQTKISAWSHLSHLISSSSVLPLEDDRKAALFSVPLEPAPVQLAASLKHAARTKRPTSVSTVQGKPELPLIHPSSDCSCSGRTLGRRVRIPRARQLAPAQAAGVTDPSADLEPPIVAQLGRERARRLGELNPRALAKQRECRCRRRLARLAEADEGELCTRLGLDRRPYQGYGWRRRRRDDGS